MIVKSKIVVLLGAQVLAKLISEGTLRTPMERNERFYKIDRLLKDRDFVPMQVFLEELEVKLATIKRDLEYLRDRYGAPIVWDRNRRGYCYTKTQPGEAPFSLPGLWMSVGEIQALVLMTMPVQSANETSKMLTAAGFSFAEVLIPPR